MNTTLKELGYNAYMTMRTTHTTGQAFEELLKDDKRYKWMCGWKNYNETIRTDEWNSFQTGWLLANEDYKSERWQENKVDDFMNELRELCKKYKVKMSVGDEDSFCAVNDSYVQVEI